MPYKSVKDVMKVAEKIYFNEKKVEKAIIKGRTAVEVERELETRI